jgi:hypothetical protein
MKFVYTALPSSTRFLIVMIFSLALGLVHPAPAHAQWRSLQSQQANEISLEKVNVDIRPEYDKPSVLVIMNIKVSAQVSLPAALSIRIPASAGKPFAVAWQSPDKALFDLNYDMKAAGDWTEIQFNTPSSDIQIEYYDPTLQKTGARRDYTYRWSSIYPVQNFSLQVQQPVNATNMTFQPDLGSGRTDDSGVTYYTLVVGKVNAGTPFDLVISYDKPDNTLTNPQQFQPAQPNQPVDSGSSGRVVFEQFLPWGLGALGLILIIAGSFWYWRTGRVPAATSRPRHNPSRSDRPGATAPGAAAPSAAAAGAGDASFCHQCGKKASPGDTFCRACGTKLR